MACDCAATAGRFPGTGELIAYEPPWCVAYRLVVESRTYVLRLTCVRTGGSTRVSVHQA